MIYRRIDSVMQLLEEDQKHLLVDTTPDISRTRAIVHEWEKHEMYMAAMLLHHEIEDLEIGMMLLENYAIENQYEEYLETVNECINKLRHVKETQKPDAGNIF